MNKLNRTNRILAGLLILQIIVAVVVLWPRGASVAAAGEPLFKDLKAESVVRVIIRDSDGRTIHLARVDGKWVLPEADNFPVLEERISPLLEKLAGMKSNRLVAEQATSHKRLRVADDDYVRLIDFDRTDGTRHSFYLGTSPTYSVSHVRLAGQNQVYLVSNLSPTDASTNYTSWINTVYLEVPTDEIFAVTIENRNGKLEFVKSEDGKWTMADATPEENWDESMLTGVPYRVDDIRIMRPLGKTAKPEWGFDTPQAVVTVQRKDKQGNISSYMFTVGAKDEADNTYALKSSESEYYIRVSEYTAKDLVEWSRESFLAKPTSTPAASGQ